MTVNHCLAAQAVSLTFPTGFKFSYSGDCRPSRDFATIGKGTTVLLHEATFDDELKGDAEAKKHSTTSEAIGVGAAMGAKRVILTHFSQRYQKIPSMSSMNAMSVKLEDADPTEDADQPIEGAEPTVETQAPTSNLSNGPNEEAAQKQPENDTQTQRNRPGPPSTSTFSSLTSIASLMKPPPRPQITDMKIGVAFDYMRVRVGDIMHLEKFNPAMRELYKEAEEDEKAKRAAKKAFSDSEDEVVEGMTEADKVKSAELVERAEKARKGQTKAAKRKKENTEKWEKEKANMGNNPASMEGRDVRMGEEAEYEPQVPEEEMERETAVQ